MTARCKFHKAPTRLMLPIASGAPGSISFAPAFLSSVYYGDKRVSREQGGTILP
jgi:hypothetical protein